jgi:hypothetical protein
LAILEFYCIYLRNIYFDDENESDLKKKEKNYEFNDTLFLIHIPLTGGNRKFNPTVYFLLIEIKITRPHNSNMKC